MESQSFADIVVARSGLEMQQEFVKAEAKTKMSDEKR